MDKEAQGKIAGIEAILKKECGFDYDGYVNSFNCYSGATAIYEAGYRKLKNKPPLLSDAGFLEWCGFHIIKGCSKTRIMVDGEEEVRGVLKCEDCRAQAQRDSDVKFYEGDR